MKKKIVIIYGHPDKESYCFALADAYKKGALLAGAEVKEIVIADLAFNPNLQFGFRKPTPFEPDLIDVRDTILWADHIVWVYPLWWGSVPALLKGFIDRAFVPGFAFQQQKGSILWDRFLRGRTARIIYTYNKHIWYSGPFSRQHGSHPIKTLMKFCGVSPIRSTSIGRIRLSEDSFREHWLKKIEQMGRRLR